MSHEQIEIQVECDNSEDIVIPVYAARLAINNIQKGDPKLPPGVTPRTSKNAFMQAHLKSKQIVN